MRRRPRSAMAAFIAATAGVLFSWNIEERAGEFFALYFALIGGVYGVFLSADAFLLFVFYEIAIVPKYFLIANWGSTNREYGAMKLMMMLLAGSIFIFTVIFGLFTHVGAGTFDMVTLLNAPKDLWFQKAFFPLLVIGCVLRFGHGAEALAWGVMFVLMPLSGIFYPIDALPPAIRPIALALPTTYAFKALRGVVDGQPLDWGLVGIGALGAVVLSLLAGWFLVAMLRTFRRRGYVTRYS